MRTIGYEGKNKCILHSETILTGLGCTFIFLYSGSVGVFYFALVQLDQLYVQPVQK